MSGRKTSGNEGWAALHKADEGDLPACVRARAERLVARFPDHGPAWVALGGSLTRLHLYESAEAALRNALSLCAGPVRKHPLSSLGHLYEARGDFPGALTWHEQAVMADGRIDATYLIFCGSIRFKQGDLEGAEGCFRSAIECPEGCRDEAFFNLGGVHLARKQFAAARSCYEQALAIDPKYRIAKLRLRDLDELERMEGFAVEELSLSPS